LDAVANPPPLKPIGLDPAGNRSVLVGRGITLRLGKQLTLQDSLLDARVVIDGDRFGGLGSVTDACSVLCASNFCRDWALRNGRPRVVAKVIGIMAVEPTYVLLTQPKLKGAMRPRRESTTNRREAGLAPFVLIEPGAIECGYCSGHNVGIVEVVKL